jgi:ParB family chromosome partitioning protein
MSRSDAGSKGATGRSPRQSRKGGVGGEPKAPSDARAQTRNPGSQAATLLRTGVAALRVLNSTLQQQLAEVRRKLEAFDGVMPTVKLDPTKVRATQWGGRRESTFQSQAFRRFKELILHAGGNIQPILVREVPGFGYEIVFGHRRHRACLELGLPVLAVVWKGGMSDAELFAAMDAENRGRQDPSTFDQGVMYAAALSAGLYTSQRRLAEAIGVSHTWVRKAILVATLPEPVVNAFGDPCQIQPAHAQQIVAALEADREALLKRAAALSSSGTRLKASDVIDKLLERAPREVAATPLVYRKRVLGSWRRDAKGRAVITLEVELSSPALMKQIETLLGLTLATGPVET